MRQAFLDPTTLKRVRRAELPVRESERVVEMLGKVAAVAKALQEAKQECSTMHIALEEAREEARIAEFAKEKADALATARGNALMKCQDALANAEEQQIQMGGMLRSALEQLGVHSPEKRMTMEQQLCMTPVFSSQKRVTPGMSGHGRHRTVTQTPTVLGSLGMAPEHLTPPSGFTVYSNALSQDISPHLYKEGGIEDYDTPHYTGEGNRPSPSSTLKTCEIGPNTAERLARMVLPHLDSEQIQCLVDYSGRNPSPSLVMKSQRTTPVVGEIQHHEKDEQQQQQHQHQVVEDTSIPQQCKRTTFSALGWEQDQGLIKAHGVSSDDHDVIDEQRKRQAAMRIVEKLNRKLPPELRRTEYDDWLAI